MRLINTCELFYQRVLVETEIKECDHPKDLVRDNYCLCCKQFVSQ